MNNSTIIANVLRFLGLIAVQVLALKQMGTSIGPYFNIILYPLFLLLLPRGSLTTVNIMLGFILGLLVDFSSGGAGIHAGAGVFGGAIRNYVFKIFAPKGGFSEKIPVVSPVHVTWQVFLSIAAVFFAAYLFWYFALDEFTLVHYVSITLKTVAAWFLSMFFVWLYCLIFTPDK